MNGSSAVNNQAAAQYAQAKKDMPHDGDADDQKVNAQAATGTGQGQKTPPPAANPKGVGGNMDVVV